jgi:hypothetical protein
VLLFGLFGWKVAALYAGTGLAIASDPPVRPGLRVFKVMTVRPGLRAM